MPCARVSLTSSRLACSLLYSRSLSSKASFSGTGSSFVSDRSSCMARGRPRFPCSRVSKLSQALLNAEPVGDSYIEIFILNHTPFHCANSSIVSGVARAILGILDYRFGSCVNISCSSRLNSCTRLVPASLSFLLRFCPSPSSPPATTKRQPEW